MLKSLFLSLFSTLARFIGDRLLRLMQDKEVQRLAIQRVELAMGLNLDNDTKRDHARDLLRADLKKLGREIAESEANALIELALSKVKEKLAKK